MSATLALWFVLSQLPNPYAGLTWANTLPGYLDAPVYRGIWTRSQSKPAGKPAGFEATDFKPAQARSVAQAMVTASKLGERHGRALVEGLNGGLDSYEREARKNNVAFAMAFLIAVALGAAGEREVADAEMVSLAQAANDELAASPAYQKLPAKQKQLLYETCVISGALIGGMAAAALETNDAELKAQAKAYAASVLETFRPAPRRAP